MAEANQLRQDSKLDGVEALVVPVPPAAAPSSHTVYYTTRRGDTLVSGRGPIRCIADPAPPLEQAACRRHQDRSWTPPACCRTDIAARQQPAGMAKDILVKPRAPSPAHKASPGHGSSSKAHSSRNGQASSGARPSTSKAANGSHAAKHSSHSKSSAHGQK